jgi:hypothetical protein
MKKPIKTNVKFKDYSQGQTMLLPPSLEEMIDVNQPVRIVNRVIDQIEIDPVREKDKDCSNIKKEGALLGRPLFTNILQCNRITALRCPADDHGGGVIIHVIQIARVDNAVAVHIFWEVAEGDGGI